VNLCLVNLLPLPALDGGRIGFIILERLRGGKRVAWQQEGFIHFVGLLFIVLFTLVISYFDVMRIFAGAGPLP
jgi:regulator of sigma E protease